VSGKSDGQHVIVTTLGKLQNALKPQRGKKPSLDLSALRCLVIDEADVFFNEPKNHQALTDLVNKTISKIEPKVQYVLFSATYPEDVKEKISNLVAEAQQVNIKKEQL